MSVDSPLPPLEAMKTQLVKISPSVPKSENSSGEASSGAGVGPTVALQQLVVPYLDIQLSHGATTLQSIHITGNSSLRLAYQDVRALAETLIMVGISIEDLALTNHSFGDNGARNVIRLLQHQGRYRCKLSRLDLSGNQIREAGVRALKQGILNNNTLTSLNLSWNPLGRQGCFDMAELVERSEDLHELVLANVDMPQSCLVALLTILADNKSLTALNVANCRLFSREDIIPSHVSRMLTTNNTLQRINFGKNGLPDSGMEIITEALALNRSSISTLYLNNNRISSTGAEALAGLLIKQPKWGLVELDLEANHITDEGARALGLALVHNHNIKKLNVRHNGITNDGLTDLLQGAGANESLNTLLVWGNHFGVGTSSCVLLASLRNHRFRLMEVFVDTAVHEVDGKTYTAELPLTQKYHKII